MPVFLHGLVPAPVLPHSLASASTVSWVIYQKYVNAMPLYRQEKDWERLGYSLSRTTMANRVIRCSEDYSIESELDRLTTEERFNERLTQEREVFEAFWSWAEKIAPTVLPKTQLGTSFYHCLNLAFRVLQYCRVLIRCNFYYSVQLRSTASHNSFLSLSFANTAVRMHSHP